MSPKNIGISSHNKPNRSQPKRGQVSFLRRNCKTGILAEPMRQLEYAMRSTEEIKDD
jgi:hypothetical protein